MKKVIIAGSSNPGNTNAILPVLKALNNDYELIIIGEQSSSKSRYPSFETFEKEGLNPLMLKPEGYQRYNTDQLHSLIHAYNPALLFTSTSRPAKQLEINGELSIDQAIIQSGKELAVPTLVLEDIWGSYRPKDFTESPSVAVLDSAAQEILQQNAPAIQNIYVTGNPYFDIYRQNNNPSQIISLRSHLGLTDEFLIAYGGQVTPNNPVSLDWVVNNLRENDKLFFGKHPRDFRNYDLILSKAGDKLIHSDLRFDSILPATDLVITHYSTVGLTAAHLGKDILTLHVEGDKPPYEGISMPHEYPLVKTGAAIGVTSESDYAYAVNNISNLESSLAQGRKQYASQSSATSKVLTVIENIMLKGNT